MTLRISLEQWETFVSVVNEGSFAKAAEALNKSQSSVSYTIGQMESRLPAPVFQQQGRKAELTKAGHTLFRHAKQLLRQAADIEKEAHFLASGWEAEVTLAVDALFPMPPIFCALQKFSEVSQRTRVRMLETTLSGTEEALLLRQADIVLTAVVPPGFMGRQISMANMIPVASSTHPLARIGATISEQNLREHRQVVMRDTGVKREQSAGWLGSEQRWTVSHSSSSISAVLNGLGFAFLPRELIGEELKSGRLVELGAEGLGRRQIPLHLVKSSQGVVGPATEALSKLLIAQFSE